MVEERGDAFRGNPKLRRLSLPWILPWGALGIPKLRLLPLLIPFPIVITSNTWKLLSHKTQQNFVRSISISNILNTLGTVINWFIFYYCIRYCILTSPWLIPPDINGIIETSKLCKQKRNLSKTEKSLKICRETTLLYL